ncbi:MAG: lipoyl(octanoyl) transferase LipB [Gemmatimonadota bacterium]
MTELGILDLGRRPYRAVLALQRSLVERRRIRAISQDLLLLVEHEPVITMGRGTKLSSMPISAAGLQQQGTEVVEVERGGDVTWHGPGQLVGYPILDLTTHRQDLHWYLRQLEEGLIQVLGRMDLAGTRVAGRTGVWTEGRKIASIGVHVRQWVTLHGFALNVHPDLRAFDQIVACGIEGVDMTSVERELVLSGRQGGLGRDRLWQAVKESTIASMAGVFDRAPVTADPELAELVVAPMEP